MKSVQLAQLIYDITVHFVNLYIDRASRTCDQMVQAARSGVQNIVAFFVDAATSAKLELDLCNVSFTLNSYAGKGELGISLSTPLLLDSDMEKYIKRLESFCEKKQKNPDLIFSQAYDNFSPEENLSLYDLLTNKLRNGIFAQRRKNPITALEAGRKKFIALTPEEQAVILLAIISSFGKGCVNGVNLELIGGGKTEGKARISNNFSNWGKIHQSAYIVYSDASGLHETKSINLLDLIRPQQ